MGGQGRNFLVSEPRSAHRHHLIGPYPELVLQERRNEIRDRLAMDYWNSGGFARKTMASDTIAGEVLPISAVSVDTKYDFPRLPHALNRRRVSHCENGTIQSRQSKNGMERELHNCPTRLNPRIPTTSAIQSPQVARIIRTIAENTKARNCEERHLHDISFCQMRLDRN